MNRIGAECTPTSHQQLKSEHEKGGLGGRLSWLVTAVDDA